MGYNQKVYCHLNETTTVEIVHKTENVLLLELTMLEYYQEIWYKRTKRKDGTMLLQRMRERCWDGSPSLPAELDGESR